MVSIPIEHYEPFLNKCDTFKLAFRMLKNGIIVHGPDGKASAVEVRCKVDEARELLDIVKRIYPDIGLALEEGIRLNVEREF